MRTITKLLRYKFNRKQRRFLTKKGYCNGCGGKGGFDFSKTIRTIILSLKGYDQAFYIKLFNDLELLCLEHDIDFTLGGNWFDFTKANLRLAWKIFRLLKFGNIFGRKSRLVLFYIVFTKLQKYGKKYFNFGKKKKLEELFKNY